MAAAALVCMMFAASAAVQLSRGGGGAGGRGGNCPLESLIHNKPTWFSSVMRDFFLICN